MMEKEDLKKVFCEMFEGFAESDKQDLILTKYAYRAEKLIDRLTFFRLDEIYEEHKEDVLRAVCAVAEILYNADAGKGVESEKTDGYSVTYKIIGDATISKRIKKVCLDYLGHTGAFYRGVMEIC